MKTYSSSEELAVDLARAEEAAFETFSRLYGPRFRAYLLARGLPVAEAESLAVSLVTDIALKAPRFQIERGGSFDSWVFTLARNGLADWWRQRFRFAGQEQIPEEPAFEMAVEMESPVRKELIDAVAQALSTLPLADQEILRRRDMEFNQSYEEIAVGLNMRPGTARVRRTRALRKLKEVLCSDTRVQPFLVRWQQALPRST
jgi:RNA polymerase sigma factor (sigma-70 family)